MTVLPFQPKPKPNSPKPQDGDKSYTPEEALKYVLQGILDNDTVPENMIIVWNDSPPDSDKNIYRLRYMTGGDPDLSSMVGMLELAKNDLMAADTYYPEQ